MLRDVPGRMSSDEAARRARERLDSAEAVALVNAKQRQRSEVSRIHVPPRMENTHRKAGAH
jgi:hypothetical protein